MDGEESLAAAGDGLGSIRSCSRFLMPLFRFPGELPSRQGGGDGSEKEYPSPRRASTCHLQWRDSSCVREAQVLGEKSSEQASHLGCASRMVAIVWSALSSLFSVTDHGVCPTGLSL